MFAAGQQVRYVMHPRQITRLQHEYDAFVVGSDQVWNPRADLYRGTQFLQFARPSQRIALAPSLGVSELNERERDLYRRELADFPRITVRESEAADLLDGLLGRTPAVLPDPTLGLTKSRWEKVADTGNAPQGAYVLTYFLGGASPAAKQEIDRAARALNLRIVDLADRSVSAWGAGPQDFIASIARAKLVMTDSYHASVFSTIFEVPFYVFPRAETSSTYSRISTLLRNLDLKGREAPDLATARDLLDQNFDSSRDRLEGQRQLLREHLRTCLA
jgi:hypothetical protein